MTFQLAPWAIDGATVDASLARLQLQSATESKSGIVGGGDLKVLALATPGPQVTVSSGAFVANGVEASFQGSYYAYNVGNAVVDIAATDASGGRTDLVYARIEDPTISGSPWSHDPATDPLVYIVVKSGVASNTTAIPSGETGVPLARITLPASTSAVTQAMITDLRALANPRSERQLLIVDPSVTDELKNSDGAKTWPSQAVWNVAIPSWATTCKVVGMWGQISSVYVTGAPDGPLASIHLKIGSINTQTTKIDSSNYKDDTNPYRSTGINADNINVSSIAGTTVQVSMTGQGIPGVGASYWGSDTSSVATVDLEFTEGLQ
jgi:hypothetical protein